MTRHLGYRPREGVADRGRGWSRGAPGPGGPVTVVPCPPTRPVGAVSYFDVPVTGSVGLLAALLAKVRFARLSPAGALAVKEMLIWQFLPGATAVVQVPGFAVKSSGELSDTAVIVRGAVP